MADERAAAAGRSEHSVDQIKEIVERGLAHCREQRPEAGLLELQQALDLAQASGIPRLVDDVRIRRGMQLIELGRTAEGLQDLTATLTATQERDDPEAVFHALCILGDAYRRAANEAEAVNAYQHAIQLGEKLDGRVDLFGPRLSLGQIRLLQGESEAALATLEPALQQSRHASDPQRERQVLQVMADACLQLNRHEQMLATHERMLELADQQRDHAAAILHRENLISILNSLGRAEQALPHIQAALEYARRKGQQGRKLVHLMELGRACYELSRLEDAEAAYTEALAAAEEQDNSRSIATILGRLGALYAEMADMEAALRFGELALVRADELGDPAILAEQSILAAMTYRDLGQPAKALQLAARAQQAYASEGEPTLAARAEALIREIQTEE